MKATLFSLALAALFWFFPLEGNVNWVIVALSIPFLIITPLLFAFAWTPLQKGEQNMTPRLLEMVSQDKKLGWGAAWLLLFPLISLALFGYIGTERGAFPFWVVLFGSSLDILWGLVKKLTAYLDPFKAMTIFSQKAKGEIRGNNLEQLIDSIDALAEVSIRAVDRGNASLARQGVAEIRDIGTHFLASSKSFANLAQDLSDTNRERVDKVAYTYFTLLARLETVGLKAAQIHMESVVSQALTALGRMAISAARYDLTLVAHPFISIGKIAQKALDNHEIDIAAKSEIVLLQSARNIIKESDLSYGDLKSPFITLLNQLEIIEQGRFKENKEITIQILKDPFLELKELFLGDKMKGLPDTPVLLTEVDRILGEFSSLEDVMRTLPPLPAVP
jgi:hypothetical protein